MNGPIASGYSRRRGDWSVLPSIAAIRRVCCSPSTVYRFRTSSCCIRSTALLIATTVTSMSGRFVATDNFVAVGVSVKIEAIVLRRIQWRGKHGRLAPPGGMAELARRECQLRPPSASEWMGDHGRRIATAPGIRFPGGQLGAERSAVLRPGNPPSHDGWATGAGVPILTTNHAPVARRPPALSARLLFVPGRQTPISRRIPESRARAGHFSAQRRF